MDSTLLGKRLALILTNQSYELTVLDSENCYYFLRFVSAKIANPGKIWSVISSLRCSFASRRREFLRTSNSGMKENQWGKRAANALSRDPS